MQHALLSASGSSRWLNCPGSRKAEEGYKDETNVFAIEGTHAHEVADLCLKNGRDADYYTKRKVLKKDVPADMIPHVQEYLDYVRSHETETSTLMTEERVDFSNVVPGGFGTMDAAILDGKTAHIFDLKYGRGVQVEAFENTQAQLYALGLLNELSFLDEIEEFVIHIVMPRKVTPDPWRISVKDLNLFAAYATEKAELAMTDSAPRVPGDKQCQWCKAKGDCPQLASFIQETICAEFDDLDTLTETTLSDYQKKCILDNQKLIENFLQAVHDSVFNLLDGGGVFEGYKMVEGRSIRKWTDEAEDYLISQLKDKAYNKKLIGIGDAEKLLGKGEVKDYLIKPAGKPTLVLDADKRPSITEGFEELD
tara:strand:+ start:4586 stop:5683 length:1098 start_codon:yes stop_codon:yes gene_type:complete